MGAPRSSTSRPARSRTVECRPSAPTVSSRPDFEPPPGVVARTPTTRPAFFDQIVNLRLHPEVKGRIALACSAMKSRKSHCGMNAMNRHLIGRCEKSATGTSTSPTYTADAGGLLVRPLQELVQEPQLVQHLEGRRVNRVAAKVPEEVSVLLQDHDVDPSPRQQEAQHHPGRTTAGDAALSIERFYLIRHRNDPLCSAGSRHLPDILSHATTRRKPASALGDRFPRRERMNDGLGHVPEANVAVDATGREYSAVAREGDRLKAPAVSSHRTRLAGLRDSPQHGGPVLARHGQQRPVR